MVALGPLDAAPAIVIWNGAGVPTPGLHVNSPAAHGLHSGGGFGEDDPDIGDFHDGLEEGLGDDFDVDALGHGFSLEG